MKNLQLVYQIPIRFKIQTNDFRDVGKCKTVLLIYPDVCHAGSRIIGRVEKV